MVAGTKTSIHAARSLSPTASPWFRTGFLICPRARSPPRRLACPRGRINNAVNDELRPRVGLAQPYLSGYLTNLGIVTPKPRLCAGVKD